MLRTLPNLIGLMSFAASVATLALAFVTEIHTRLASATHGDFTKLTTVYPSGR